MKVGDLVTKRLDEESETLFGIILKMDELGIKVFWNKSYGIFWTLKKTVSIAK